MLFAVLAGGLHMQHSEQCITQFSPKKAKDLGVAMLISYVGSVSMAKHWWIIAPIKLLF